MSVTQSALIERIYAAALEPSLWRDLLAELARSVGSPGAVLQVQARGNGEVLFAAVGGLDEAALAVYVRDWAHRDPRLAVGLPARVGETLAAEDHLDLASFRRSAIYNEFLAPLDLGATLGSIVLADRDIFVAASAQRSLRLPRFDAEERRRFAALVPHLARAARIAHELGAAVAARSALSDALDRLGRGALVVDARLAVRYANRRAEQILAERDGLRVERGILTASGSGQDERLRRGVRAALHAEDSGAGATDICLPVSRPSGRRSLEVMIALPPPGVSALVPGRRVALVLIVDPERLPSPPAEALREFYGLTRAEARLAVLVGEGMALPEAAERLRVTHETVRTILRGIFAKTATRRQSELARLLTGGPAAAAEFPGSPPARRER